MNAFRSMLAVNVGWTALSQTCRLGGQLLTTMILARLLPAADFGLVALAMIVTGFVALFRDLGTSSAIVQRRDIGQSTASSVHWLNLAVGVALCVLIEGLAPAIARILSNPSLAAVLQISLLALPISSLGVVPLALLEKASRFRCIALIEATSALLGLLVAVWTASLGWGVYSLVSQSLLIAATCTVGYSAMCQWRPTFSWNRSALRGILGFGANVAGFNVVNYLIRNVDNLLIGRYLGATDLGYYSMAYRLMLWPLQNISGVVGRALFPILSGLQADRAALARAYVRATAAVVVITAPLMFGFFALREALVVAALGDRWRPVADLLTWLVPVGLLQSIGTTVGSLYLATGRTDLMFKWGMLSGSIIVPAFVIGLEWGIVGVAASYAIASVVLFWPSLALPYRLVDLRVAGVLQRLAPSLLSAAAMAIAVSLISYAWPEALAGKWAKLIALVFVGAIAYLGMCLRFQRPLVADLTSAILRRRE